MEEFFNTPTQEEIDRQWLNQLCYDGDMADDEIEEFVDAVLHWKNKAVQCALSNVVEQSKRVMWTNINDNKPDTGVNVLVAITPNKPNDAEDNPKMGVGYLMPDNYTWILGGRFGFDVGTVTHWQHLPEPPSE